MSGFRLANARLDDISPNIDGSAGNNYSLELILICVPPEAGRWESVRDELLGLAWRVPKEAFLILI